MHEADAHVSGVLTTIGRGRSTLPAAVAAWCIKSLDCTVLVQGSRGRYTNSKPLSHEIARSRAKRSKMQEMKKMYKMKKLMMVIIQ